MIILHAFKKPAIWMYFIFITVTLELELTLLDLEFGIDPKLEI